jgi:hypothetical protein
MVKMKKKKHVSRLGRVLKYMLIVVAVLLALDVGPAFFYRPETNDTPLPSYYKKGVYHMHSVFSDGKGTADEIAAAAAGLGLDFVILTDHGRPNLESSRCTAWKGDVLLIGGTELSLRPGHLAAMGFKIPGYIFPPEAQEAIDEIVGDGGVCFISHPFDDKIPWTDWSVRGVTGLEVLSSYTEARKSGLPKLLTFPLKYSINSRYSLLNAMNFPVMNFKRWDDLNKRKGERFYGIYALDAHGKLPISKSMQLNFPSYRSMFEILTVYVKIEGKLTAASIIGGLKKGNFFNAIEGIAPANGFEAFFIEKGTKARIQMGGSSSCSSGRLYIRLPFDFPTGVRVSRNGRVYKALEDNREKALKIKIEEPGVYRVEVFARDNTFDRLPWIASNPFFIGMEEETAAAREASPLPRLDRPVPGPREAFHVEKNQGSEGRVTVEDDGNITCFPFKLKRDPGLKDFWAALALREKMDFSGCDGVVLEARSDSKRRFWVEFRTGDEGGSDEMWLRHSFLADTGWQTVFIPFDRFAVIVGDRDKTPNLKDVRSFFIAINNANAYAGAEGALRLRGLGLYRQ